MVTVVATVAVPAVRLAAVPLTLVITPDAGVPRAGVIRVGDVPKTAAPDPVSLVNAVASCAEVNDPSTAALPTEVT